MLISVDNTDERNVSVHLEIPEEQPPFFKITGRKDHRVITEYATTRSEAKRRADALITEYDTKETLHG